MKKIIKQISIMLLSMILMIPYVIYAGEIEADGTYHIKNITLHDNPVGVAMSRSYMNEITEVVKEGSELTATLEFNNTQFMGEFKVKVNGNVVNHEIVYYNQETHIKKLSFKLGSLQDEITVGFYVQPMSTDVEFGVDFDESAITYIKGTDDAVEQENKGTISTQEVADKESLEQTLEEGTKAMEEAIKANPEVHREEKEIQEEKVVEKEQVAKEEKVAEEEKITQEEVLQEEVVEDQATHEEQEVTTQKDEVTTQKDEVIVTKNAEASNAQGDKEDQTKPKNVGDKQEAEIQKEDENKEVSEEKETTNSLIVVGVVGVIIGLIVIGVKKWLKR